MTNDDKSCKKSLNGLRGALRHLCDEDSLFEPLWASFIIVSSESSERLNASLISFPSYTRHDYKHAMNVVAKMEMLIGENRLAQLKPTDIWLLLMCAFTHDWGMTVSLADLMENINNGSLDKHLEWMKKNSKGAYYHAAHELDLKQIKKQLKATKEKYGVNADSLINAINTQRSLMLVLQSHFRPLHADGYGKTLNEHAYHGVSKRLQVLVAQINKTHMGDWNEVMSLPHVTDGFATEHAHPRFAAAMLRLADLLDVDSGRVNPYQVRVVENPDDSIAHQEKHLAVERLLTSPKKISAVFNFEIESIERHFKEYGQGAIQRVIGYTNYDDDYANNRSTQIRAQAARLVISWYDMLKDELKNLASDWNEIVPEGYLGSAPNARDDDFSVRFDDEEIKPRDLDLRYELNYVRAFDIIRGAGLYTDQLTFIRELIQNAMDAQKIQLFVDWEYKNGKMKPDEITLDRFFSSLPYDLWDAAVHVEVETIIPTRHSVPEQEELIILRISDNGTGISREKLRKMRYVGSIYDHEIEQIKSRMPEWLKPTGSFGIGMQSVFDFQKQSNTLQGEFTIYTKSALTNESLKIIFKANQTDGEIFAEADKTGKRIRNGTDVEVPLTDHSDVIFKLFDNAVVDKFSSKGERIASLICEYLEDTVRGDIIPLIFNATERKRVNKITEGKRWSDKSKEKRLIDNVFRDAFPEIFVYSNDYEHDYFRPVFKDIGGAPTLGFWHWNHEHNILIYVSLKERIAEIRKRSDIFSNAFSGKASFVFRGIRVSKPDRQERGEYRFSRLSTPWSDVLVYVMGGDAGELLAINRESFLDKSTSSGLKVEEMEKHVIDTLRKGFENFLFFFADIAENNAGIEPEILDDYLTDTPAALILLTLASHCLYKKSISTPQNNLENSEMVVIDGMSAKKISKTLEYLQRKLESKRNIFTTDVIDYDYINRQIIESRSIDFVQLLCDIDNIWFTTKLPYANREREMPETDRVIQIYEDILSDIPVKLYWSDLFFYMDKLYLTENIEENDRNEDYVIVPTPVYKYCSAARKSFNLDKNDVNALFAASKKYGELQASLYKTNSTVMSNGKRLCYKTLLNLFGERHVFPALSKYEKLAIPYDKITCPKSLKNCGYVLITPITPLVFTDNVIVMVQEKWESWRKRWYNDREDIWIKEELNGLKRSLVWYAFSGKRRIVNSELNNKKTTEKEPSRVLREAENDLLTFGRAVSEDPYGIIKLIEHVQNSKGGIMPVEEYTQAYIDFLVDYIYL